MDEQKPLENKQGEPGKKTEKSEYSFMQETIKDENSRGKKCRKDLLRMAGYSVCVPALVFLRSNHGLIRSFPEIHKR
mgnify:CR=1 FL=1